jgi:cystathionine beta-lyase
VLTRAAEDFIRCTGNRRGGDDARRNSLVESLELFGIGFSWGGYESLIQPSYPERSRTATRWQAEGPHVRIHIGLEDPQDLIADLAQGLDRLRATAAA